MTSKIWEDLSQKQDPIQASLKCHKIMTLNIARLTLRVIDWTWRSKDGA
jgi:hypothetical protein